MAEADEIYHERQSQMLCGLHALNNLLQKQAFTRQDFDEICTRLAPNSSQLFNPHRSWLGMGNYDINVLTMAIESTGLELQWWDKRKQLADLDVSGSTMIGFLLNIASNVQLGSCRIPGVKRPHWIAVRWLPAPYEAFYNLDSKLAKPQRLGPSPQDVRDFLAQQLADQRAQLLLVKQPIESNNNNN